MKIMKMTKRKFKDPHGETIIEVLASVLIAALSVTLLIGAVMTSGRLDKDARETDKKFYINLSAAHDRTVVVTVADSKIKISGTGAGASLPVEIPVLFYGGGGVLSYVADTGGGPP